MSPSWAIVKIWCLTSWLGCGLARLDGFDGANVTVAMTLASWLKPRIRRQDSYISQVIDSMLCRPTRPFARELWWRMVAKPDSTTLLRMYAVHRQVVEDVDILVHPAAPPSGLWTDLAERRPDAHRQLRRSREAALLHLQQHFGPALYRFSTPCSADGCACWW